MGTPNTPFCGKLPKGLRLFRSETTKMSYRLSVVRGAESRFWSGRIYGFHCHSYPVHGRRAICVCRWSVRCGRSTRGNPCRKSKDTVTALVLIDARLAPVFYSGLAQFSAMDREAMTSFIPEARGTSSK
jgi:hypothetical protein